MDASLRAFDFNGTVTQWLKYPVEMLWSLCQPPIPPGYVQVSWTCVRDLL